MTINKQKVGKPRAKKAVINFTAHKTMYDDVKNSRAFKRGYEKEMLLEFAETIKGLRTKRGLTQKEIALKARTKQQVISRLESGVEDIKLSTFFRIATVLHLDLEKFVHDSKR